jgi:hypothetical protein
MVGKEDGHDLGEVKHVVRGAQRRIAVGDNVVVMAISHKIVYNVKTRRKILADLCASRGGTRTD